MDWTKNSQYMPVMFQNIFDNVSHRMVEEIFSSPENDDPMSPRVFQNFHPYAWTQQDVVDWVYFVAGYMRLKDVSGEKFRSVTGPQLVHMTLQGFLDLDPINGRHLFTTFRDMYDQVNFEPPMPLNHCMSTCSSLSPNSDHEDEHFAVGHLHTSDSSVSDLEVFNEFTDALPEELDETFAAQSVVYDLSTNMSRIPKTVECMSEPDPWSDLQRFPDDYSTCTSLTTYLRQGPTTDVRIMQSTTNYITGQTKTKKHEGQGEDKPCKGKRGRKKGQLSKGPHLWEFIRDMLNDPFNNQTVIRWEDRGEGIFKIMKTNTLSEMWGLKKKRKNDMNYEKLSRALRFCRQQGFFMDVPQDGRFSKKLVFKFGPKATNWQKTSEK